jgi:radial spoke head protein 1
VGKGEAIYPNGDVYTGEILHNQRQGVGKYVWKAAEEGKSGGVYEGGYDANKKNGKGLMKYPDNGTYDGMLPDHPVQIK